MSAKSPVRVLDLAAGSGVWGIALGAKLFRRYGSPLLTGPASIETTKKMVEKFGLADQFRFSPGDLHHADFGSGYDIATLGHILHSEGENRSRELLAKTFNALAPGGNHCGRRNSWSTKTGPDR